MRGSSVLFLLLLFGCFNIVLGQRILPAKLEIDKSQSLKTNEIRVWKAAESIIFYPGFKSQPGTQLIAKVGLNQVEIFGPERSEKQIKVYPNPIINFIKLSGVFKNEKLWIYNQKGHISKSVILHGAEPEVNVAGLKNGTYFLKVRNQVIRLIK